MAEDKKNRIKKVTADTLAIFMVILIIAVYVVFNIRSATDTSFSTITAVKSTVYDTIETKALVVRDEHIIDGQSSELTVSCIGDGEKIGVGGNIAMNFGSKESAANYAKLKELHNQLDYYIELQNRVSASVTDVATLDRDTLSDINSYIQACNYGSISKLSDYNDDINDKLTRHQMLVGEKIDFSSKTTELENQINSINADAAQPISYITSSESGIYSSYLDGMETAFDYENLLDINVDTLNGYIKEAEKNKQSSSGIGKLISSYEWYICCVVDADEVVNIKNGDVISVEIKDNDLIIDCTVVSGTDVNLGQEQTVLILKSAQMNGAISSLRLENIEIRTAEYTGFKVPSSAIHIDKNGKKMVYALVGEEKVPRYSNVLYSNKDFTVFDYDEENSKTIKYYDQIITKGKGLYNGNNNSKQDTSEGN
ncbi:MAG: hypothetical protein NC213_00660 [Acetobacter sp.]|nr:hypothetical protein [Bacteroides sp.]MCM1340238.1 hypothetical protein [Acetobacter sp.]MCM1432810.1 hypothetical protein [Clostridiales bacterium]